MDELETVKRRVKKLLALSKSPFEAEAESAIRKANALIAEYKISRTEFSEYTSKTLKATKRAVQWKVVLANAVELLYATYHYRDTMNGELVFYGEELDVFMSTEMYSYLIKTVERMAKQNVRKNAKYHFRQSYKKGMADRLWDRMYELGKNCSWRNPKEREQKQKEISDWVEKNICLKPAVKSNTMKVNKTALYRGMNDADGVCLARQMTGSGTRRISGW